MPWLVTWEASNDELLPPRRIAAILSGRLGADTVRIVVESLYATHLYTEAEMTSSASANPYPAEFGSIDGVTFRGHITCGHNPFLFARKVDRIRLNRVGQVIWTERPLPSGRP